MTRKRTQNRAPGGICQCEENAIQFSRWRTLNHGVEYYSKHFRLSKEFVDQQKLMGRETRHLYFVMELAAVSAARL
jgi:hypothetical protein